MGRKMTTMCPGPSGDDGCPEGNERPLRTPGADPSKSKYRRGTCRTCSREEDRRRRERIKGMPCPGSGDFKGGCGQPIAGRLCPRCAREEKQVWTHGVSTSEKRRMFERQNGLCPCGDPMDFDESVIDHCHANGHVRGLLHGGCNMAIGLLYENAERALNLFRWLATDPRA